MKICKLAISYIKQVTTAVKNQTARQDCIKCKMAYTVLSSRNKTRVCAASDIFRLSLLGKIVMPIKF